MDAAQVLFSLTAPVILLAVARWYSARRDAQNAAPLISYDIPLSPVARAFSDGKMWATRPPQSEFGRKISAGR
jgi:hypothetical protein